MLVEVSSSETVGQVHFFPNQTDVTAHSQSVSYTNLHPMTSSSRVEDQRVLECHRDGVSFISEARDAHLTVHNMGFEKKDTTQCVGGIEFAIRNEATHGHPNVEIEQSHQMPHQPTTSASERENSAAIQDDVEVCDICGDTGQEELLAICSQCSDGAEHTYCMRIMLDKLPEGAWLCEGCKLKEETECQNVDKSEAAPGTSEIHYSHEPHGSVGNTSDTKLLPTWITKVSDQDSKWASKEPGSPQVSDTRHSGIAEVTLVTTTKASETSVGSKEDFISRKQTGFPRPSLSCNVDMEKINQSTLSASFGDYSSNNTKPLAHSQVSILTSNIQAGLQSSRGPLSKSVSFNDSKIKPKVKQLTGILPCISQMVKKTYVSNTKKEKSVKEMTKSVSYKGMGSGYGNAETMSKIRSVLPKAVDSRDMKQAKERNAVEKKSCPKIDPPLVSSKPTSIPIMEPDLEVTQSSVSNILGGDVGSDDANNLVKKQSNETHDSDHRKLCQVISNNDLHANSVDTDMPCCEAGTVFQRGTHRTSECVDQDDKTKDLIFISSSKQTISGGSQILRSQDCNQTGLSAEYCSVNIFNKSSLKPSADWNSKVTGKVSEWKDAAEAATSKKTLQKSKILAHHNEKLLMSATDQLNVKAPMQNFPDQTSVLVHPLRASAIPHLEFLWQGSFKVLKTGRYPELCDGIQAHLSTCASKKVLEVATKFPCTIQVNEVARLSSWPLKFQRNGPKEDNIALYFFAKDIESYEKSYRNLLDNMLRNDLALRGSIDGVELLIFPSNKFPEISQRWNRLFFLWGVFRGRKTNFLDAQPGTKENPGVSTLNVKPLSAALTSKVSTSLKMDSIGSRDNELPISDESSESTAVKSITCMEFQPISSSNIESRSCDRQESHQTFVDNKLPSECSKSSVPNNFGRDSEDGKDVAPSSHANQGAGIELNNRIEEDEERPIGSDTILDNHTHEEEDLMEIDYLHWKSRKPDEETIIPESSMSRNLFPMDGKQENMVYVLSSDDEDSPEPNATNLELGLGGEKKSSATREKSRSPLRDDSDDSSASLSLSLAFPPTEKKLIKKMRRF